MERKVYLDKILDRLSYLKSKIEINNSLNLTDINIISENFYRDFLNILHGYNLENINKIEPNAQSIDLGDEINKIAFQITSTSSNTKIKNTVDLFIKNKLFKKYSRLIILNIAKKPKNNSNDNIGEEGVFMLSKTTDVWDIKTLSRNIDDMELNDIKNICAFVEKEISFASADVKFADVINDSNLVLLAEPGKLRLENYGKELANLCGSKFDQGPAIMDKMTIPPGHHHYFLTSKLEVEAHYRIGKNGEALKSFEAYLSDASNNEYIARFRLLFIITNGTITIHPQQLGVSMEKWSV